jgi:hypothetical protein
MAGARFCFHFPESLLGCFFRPEGPSRAEFNEVDMGESTVHAPGRRAEAQAEDRDGDVGGSQAADSGLEQKKALGVGASL